MEFAIRLRTIRLLASDIDGTLPTSDHQVPAEVRDAFAAASRCASSPRSATGKTISE